MTSSKNVLLIMGNGFDLSCGLKSSYDDFFGQREDNLERIVKETQAGKKDLVDYVESKYPRNSNNLNNDLMTKLKELNQKEDEDYLNSNPITRWDCVFVLIKKYISSACIEEWNDVENVIFNVVTFLLVDDTKWFNLNIKKGEKENFSKEIKRCFYSKKKCQNKKPILSKRMLDDLKDFEEIFASYISGEVQSNELYELSARELIKKLARKGMSKDEEVNVDIFSFNYSLNANQREICNKFFERNNANLRINSWYNIHGIADSKSMAMVNSNIIFGIDITDLLDNNTQPTLTNNLLKDPRIEFTKSFRIISNHVNMIRDAVFNSKEDKIIIYGHSLNTMDYSYFRTLFEMFHLYRSNKITLELYYYPKKDTDTVHTEEKNNIEKLVNLLITYSKTLGDQYENSIVDKLILEDRLSVISMGKESEYSRIRNNVINDIKPMIEINNKKDDLDSLSSDDKLFLGTILSNTKSDISKWTERDLNKLMSKLRKKGYMDGFVDAFEKSKDINADVLVKAKELASFIGED